MFDSVGHPNAERSPTASGSTSVTAEDSSSTQRLIQLMILIIAAQKAVPDKASHSLAMRARGNFELGQQIVDILRGRTDPATHDGLFQLSASS
jgi:hypothetical protein